MGIGKENQNNSSFIKAGGIGGTAACPDNPEGKRLLLYRLTGIVKALFPTRQTYSPYPIEQSDLCQELDEEDRLLFSDLLHSLTLLNNLSRLPSGQRLISTQADFLNALQLILPRHLQLTPKSIEAHGKLLDFFGNRTFDYVLAGSRLKVSVKTVRRLFKPLIAHGLIYQHPTKPCDRALFQAIESANTSQELFETMQGDWKDFVGFVEF